MANERGRWDIRGADLPFDNAQRCQSKAYESQIASLTLSRGHDALWYACCGGFGRKSHALTLAAKVSSGRIANRKSDPQRGPHCLVGVGYVEASAVRPESRASFRTRSLL